MRRERERERQEGVVLAGVLKGIISKAVTFQKRQRKKQSLLTHGGKNISKRKKEYLIMRKSIRVAGAFL